MMKPISSMEAPAVNWADWFEYELLPPVLVARGPWAADTFNTSPTRRDALTHVVNAPEMASEKPAAAKVVSKTRVTDWKGGRVEGVWDTWRV